MDVYLGGKHDTDEEHKVGEVRMPCCGGGFKPTLNIQDKKGDTKAVVKGPCCFVSDLCGSTFEVITLDASADADANAERRAPSVVSLAATMTERRAESER